MIVTAIPIVTGALQGLIKGIEESEIKGQIETINVPALLKSA